MRLFSLTIRTLLLLLLAVVIFSACSLLPAQDQSTLPAGAYDPAPEFARFYQKNGGYDVFRHAISTVFSNPRGEKYQFYETVLMVYDPIKDRVYFDDLGDQLGVRALPVQEWTEPISQDGLIVGQFYIHPAFVPLFLEFGPDQVGQPLTQPYYNFSKNRMEQHFQNMGLYFSLDDPEQKVALLNYGEVACESCALMSAGPQNAILDVPREMPFFYEQMDLQHISISLTGDTLTGPVQVNDGSTEVVFDNMALYEKDGQFAIRPLPLELGYKERNLYYSLNSSMFVFYEYQEGNGAGHNVLVFFDTYIRENGGYQVSGRPITEIMAPDTGVRNALRQCFENVCLDYFHYADGPKVRPVALGERYLETAEKNFLDDAQMPQDDPGTDDFSSQPRNLNPFVLLLWENHTVIDSNTSQTITVMVELENTPQVGKEIALTVQYPDGHTEVLMMPATGDDGATSLSLPPIQGENGDLVYYEACLYVQNGMEPACVQESFLIWGNP